MTRKVIQLATVSDGPDFPASLFALCDDGSIWWVDSLNEEELPEWKKFPELPADRVD